jgi:RNA polymerase sigma factor (sigma-70 family)
LEIEEIIEGCKAGNQKCQNSLVHTFAPRLMALCMRYTKNEDLAKDALQETFIAAFKYIHTFENKGSFEGWLRKIAANSSIKLIKKMYEVHLYDETMIDNNAFAEVPDVYSNLSIEEILKLLHKLPHSQNVIFNLSVVEGYNHAEIGQMLGITESTSRSTLCKARNRLVELLNEENIKQNNFPKWSFA